MTAFFLPACGVTPEAGQYDVPGWKLWIKSCYRLKYYNEG